MSGDVYFVAVPFHLILVAGLGFEPRMAKAYETLLVTGPFPHYKVETAYIRAVDISVSRVTYLYVVHFIRLTLTSCHPL